MSTSRDYGDGRNPMAKAGKENDPIERIRRFFGGEIYLLKVKKKILNKAQINLKTMLLTYSPLKMYTKHSK